MKTRERLRQLARSGPRITYFVHVFSLSRIPLTSLLALF